MIAYGAMFAGNMAMLHVNKRTMIDLLSWYYQQNSNWCAYYQIYVGNG